MSHQSLGFEPSDPHVLPSQRTLAAGLPNPDWIPPPALLGAINADAIDFNDEVFFPHNSVSAYTADPYSPTEAHPAASSPSSLSNANYNSMNPALPTAEGPLVSRLKLDRNTHYSHHRRFSSAAEQLDRMTLRASKSPSPVLKRTAAYPPEKPERTINPRQLFGNGSGDSLAMGGKPPPTVNSAPARYILPSSVSSPSLSTAFFKVSPLSEYGPVGDLASPQLASSVDVTLGSQRVENSPGLANSVNQYVMNDECLSAITYWLNNTADVISEKPDRSAIQNPTGIMKPAWSRRNSIQVVPQRSDEAPRFSAFQQKRKRRKSDNVAGVDLALSLQGTQAPEAALESPVLEHIEPAHVQRELHQEPPEAEPELAYPGDSRHEHDAYGRLGAEHDERELASERDLAFDRGDDEPKPFPCPECDKQFKRSEHLKRHIRSVHSNIRPFHCKYCDKKFSRSDNLAQHSKTHFKVNANGTTTIIYGNPNPHNRGGRKRSA